jgi:hypothetical protein
VCASILDEMRAIRAAAVLLLIVLAADHIVCLTACEHACCHKCGRQQPLFASAPSRMTAALPQWGMGAPAALAGLAAFLSPAPAGIASVQGPPVRTEFVSLTVLRV